MNKITCMLAVISIMSCSKVDLLYEDAKIYQDRVYTKEMIRDLPEPVKQYFNYALTEGQPYINFLRLKHTGSFKTGQDKKWMDIEGEQYFRTNPPGFVWVGKTSMFKARDSYYNDEGNLSVYLFGIVRIVKEKGDKIDQAELLRWLGESVWMPTNLLPDENKTWTPIDDSTAKLTFTYNGLTVYYDITFNEKGQIVKLETDRYMEDSLERWVGEVSDYEEVESMMIPTRIKASWLLDEEKYTYADFQVTEFEFNNPQKF